MVGVGERITINAQHPEGGEKFTETATVEILCKKFCVLNNGKYRFCAYYDDIKHGRVIVL